MENLKKYRLDLLLLAIAISLPIVLWVTMAPLSQRFTDIDSVLLSLGQITALLGTTFVAVSMIFQVKLCRYYTFLSKPTTGLNIHHYAGLYGLLLLIAHPLFLAARILPNSLQGAFHFLYTTNITNLLAIIALLLMILSMYTTIFMDRSFRFWKLFHQIMLVAYLGVLYHVLFVNSDITANAVLRWYLVGLLTLGGMFFTIQKVQHYLKPKVIRDEDAC